MNDENKIITIFNKNGISIVKYIDRGNLQNISYPYATYIVSSNDIKIPPTKYTTKDNGKYVIKRKESKLGFYYDSKEYIYNSNSDNSINYIDLTKTIVNVYIRNIDKDYTYKISYLLNYHGTKVNKEIRPWDLLGGPFPDNYVFGLLEDINRIFDELSSYKDSKAYSNEYSINSGNDLEKLKTVNVNEIRKKIINDLFGNPEGPKFQTNNEKILAHGFDLKTSFRNIK